MNQNHTIMRSQAGSSLLEVMVALIILSIGLMGLAMLQLKGMQFNTNAYFRTQATISANDIIERMRTNAGAHTSYTAAIPGSKPTPDCDTAICTGIQLAAHDLFAWSNALTNPATGIPGAFASISASSTGATVMKYVIKISWTEEGVAVPAQEWALQL